MVASLALIIGFCKFDIEAVMNTHYLDSPFGFSESDHSIKIFAYKCPNLCTVPMSKLNNPSLALTLTNNYMSK